ncbi:MAG: S9 family peptidase [Planctomycetota bacterium]
MRVPLLLLAACAARASSAQDRNLDLLTAESLVTMARVAEPAPSPDGARLAYVVRTADIAENRSIARLHVLDLRDHADHVVPGEGSAFSPMWSPDGRRLAFVSTRGGSPQIWIADADGGGRARRVTDHPGGVSNAEWSPDGRWFLFTARVKVGEDLRDLYPDLPKANARAYDDLMVRHWDEWKDGTYSHLFVVDANGGAAMDLMPDDRFDTPLAPFGGSEQIAWSPDGEEICYTMKRVADPEASTDSSLFVVGAEGGASKCLTEGMPGFDQDPVYSPDGKWIAFGSMARGGFESDRMRLMLHERATGKSRELLPDLDASAHGAVWSQDSSALYFTVETKGTTQIYRATLSGEFAPLTSGRHALSSLRLAPGGKALYALRTTMERPAEVVRVDLADGSIQAVTHANDALYDRLALPAVEEEWFPATDGARIHSWIVKPPGFDPSKRYPLLLYCQGGPQSMVGHGFSFRWNFHLMAANGYVVAAVNRRGLPGFGQAWNDAISRDWGGQCMRDLLSVFDAVRERPYVDRDHCGAVGASFGGYTIYWLMGHAGDRFACMIAHCGVFNLESMYLSTEELWFPNWDLGGPYWSSEAVAADYRRFSPHNYVANWKTPLLIIEGERDFRVPYDQGLQAFTAAQVRHVQSRLLVFPDAGHWILGVQDSLLWHREFYGWLDRWCKPKQEEPK